MLENSKLRLRFEKSERAIYISHLDLMRTIQRAFLRAELPLKYSEGFNPHAQISILLPLSLGMSSVCELMDFRLTEDIDVNEIVNRLNPVLPEGVRAIEIGSAERKSRELKWLKITGRFEYDTLSTAQAVPLLRDFFSRESIVIQKKTKRGMGESDIAPAISSLELTAGENTVCIEAIISAQEPTLNPDNLVNALKQLMPELAPNFAQFHREEVYDAEMKVFR